MGRWRAVPTAAFRAGRLSAMPVFSRDDDFTINFETWGDPASPAVVLLHGFTGDLRNWARHAEALAGQYLVIAPDLRGHGQTSAPEDLDSYTMEAYADDLRALLDHLGVDICAIVGSSFGGMIALQFATTWPERVAGLVVSDTSAAYDNPAYAEPYRRREAGMLRSEETVRGEGTAGLGRRAAAGVADSFLAEGIRRRYARMSSAGFLGAARVRRTRPDLLPVLRERLTMPVMLCIGEDDPVLSATEVMAEQLPGARFVLFKEAGHGVPQLRPEAFTRELLGFLGDIEAGEPIALRRSA